MFNQAETEQKKIYTDKKAEKFTGGNSHKKIRRKKKKVTNHTVKSRKVYTEKKDKNPQQEKKS